MSEVGYKKYVDVGRQRIVDHEQVIKAEEARIEKHRISENRKEWMVNLAMTFRVLPEELHGSVVFDDNANPNYPITSRGGPRHAILKLIPFADIHIQPSRYSDGGTKFIARRASHIEEFENHYYVIYEDGTSYEDPLMAIAEAASFGPDNADMEADCEQANAAPRPKAIRAQATRTRRSTSELLAAADEHLDDSDFDAVIAISLLLLARDAMEGCG